MKIWPTFGFFGENRLLKLVLVCLILTQLVELKTDWTSPFNKDFLEQLFEFTHHNPKSGPETVIVCGISRFFPIFRLFKFLDSTALVSKIPNFPSPAALFWPLLILLDKENHDSEADKVIVWALPVGLVWPQICFKGFICWRVLRNPYTWGVWRYMLHFGIHGQIKVLTSCGYWETFTSEHSWTRVGQWLYEVDIRHILHVINTPYITSS